MTDLEALAARVEAKDVAAIAAGLTKAQRGAIHRDGAWSIVTARGLAKHGLLTSYAKLTGENWVRLYWSELGLAIRAHLGGTHDR